MRIVKIEYHRQDGNWVWVGGKILESASYVKPGETIIPERWLQYFEIGGHFWADGDTIHTCAPGEPLPQ